jgi:sugar phosphate isomerase/epimerase
MTVSDGGFARTWARLVRMARTILLGADVVGGAEGLRAAISEANRFGFHGIEWMLADTSQSAVLQAGLNELDRGAASDSKGHGNRSVHSLTLALHNEDPARAIDESVRLLGSLQELHPITMSLSIPPLQPAGGEPGLSRYRDGLNFAYQVLRGLRFEAEAAGVQVAIDAAHGGCLLSPVEVGDLIDAVNSPAIGACVDVDLVSSVGDPLDWLATLGPRVSVVRLGRSDFSMKRLAAILNELRFAGPVVVKHDVSADDRPGLIEELSVWSTVRSRNLAEGSDSQ